MVVIGFLSFKKKNYIFFFEFDFFQMLTINGVFFFLSILSIYSVDASTILLPLYCCFFVSFFICYFYYYYYFFFFVNPIFFFQNH